MKRGFTLLFILFLVIAPVALVANRYSTTKTTGPNFRNPEIDYMEYDDSQSHDEVNAKLNIMFFSQAAPNEEGIYYVCRSGVDVVAYFGISEVFYCVDGSLIELKFPGSNQVIPVGESQTGSVTNYLYGSNPDLWYTGLEDFASLRYANIYPGIDLVYEQINGSLKYEFIIAPNANADLIEMKYPNADGMIIENDCLIVSIGGVSLKDSGLLAYQNDAENTDVDCIFQKLDRNTIGFRTADYSTSLELTIDPILIFSTYLGGSSSEQGWSIATEDGYTYITGYTTSVDYPTLNGYDETLNSVYEDCFVTKLDSDNQTLIYSTFIGGTDKDYGKDIDVEDGCVYIAGYTWSTDFPTSNAYDSTYNGGVYDCFVTKLAANGSALVYSTYLGGSSGDYGLGIAVEDSCVFVTGYTTSTGFPTINAYDSSHNGNEDCFLTKFAANGTTLIFSTFIGGSSNEESNDIAIESGYAYLTGYTDSAGFPTLLAYDSSQNGGNDCFITKFSTNGQSLVYSTFLGGTSNDVGNGIAVESGYAYITGTTSSSAFPFLSSYDQTLSGSSDCFLTKLATSGSSLVYSTYLGGSSSDEGYSIAVEDGYAYLTGSTSSSDFPSIKAYDPTYNGIVDCFVTRFAATGISIDYSTFIGGNNAETGYGIAVEDCDVYITGSTYSSDFPTASAIDSTYNEGYDCFVCVLTEDTDMDGLTDKEEELLGTSPTCIDTDCDNFLDGYEVEYGSNPLDPMSYPSMPQSWYTTIYRNLDGNATLIQQVISWLDGNNTAIQTLFTHLTGNASLLLDVIYQLGANSTELQLLAALVDNDIAQLQLISQSFTGDIDEIRDILDQLGISVGDADYDGLDDLDEIDIGTDLLCIDTDCDNLNDAFEVKLGTNPLDDDSDGDSYLDGLEVIAGTDPLNALDYPGSEQRMNINLIIIVVSGVGVIITIVILSTRYLRGKK